MKRIRPYQDEKKALTIARRSVLVLLILAAYISIMKPPSMIYITQVAGAGHAQIAVATIGLLYWKKSTKQGALFGIFAGIIVAMGFTTIGVDFNWYDITPFGWGFMANILVFIVVSLLTKAPDPEYRADYFKPLTDNLTR
jgi:Na+/proline symporter